MVIPADEAGPTKAQSPGTVQIAGQPSKMVEIALSESSTQLQQAHPATL